MINEKLRYLFSQAMYYLPIEDVNLNHIDTVNPVWISQPKANGIYANCFVYDNQNVDITSRDGKNLAGCGRLKQIWKYAEPGLYIGEAIIIGEDFTEANRYYNPARKTHIYTEEKEAILVFDFIPIEDFFRGKCDTPYHLRYKNYVRRINNLQNIANNDISIQAIRGIEHLTFADARKHLETHLNNGWEANMIKHRDGKWIRGSRNNNNIKDVPRPTLDLEILDIVEGEGKFAGIAGKLVLKYKNKTIFADGKFDDALRKDMLINPENYIGKTAVVSYKDLTNKGNPFQAKVESIRWDK